MAPHRPFELGSGIRIAVLRTRMQGMIRSRRLTGLSGPYAPDFGVHGEKRATGRRGPIQP